MNQIKIGTIVQANEKAASYIEQIIPYGFECFTFTYGGGKFNGFEPEKLADAVMPVLREKQIEVSNISVFGNMLEHTEEAEHTRQCFKHAIDTVALFGSNLVTGFTGRETGKSIPDNIGRFREIWLPLTEYAASKGVRIAFENCLMGGNWNTGNWNIAINPDAWELMFDAVPLDNIGLEWEPCHQMVQLIDPLPQIREWGKRFFQGRHNPPRRHRETRFSRQGSGVLAQNARLRRFQLDGHHFRTAPRILSREHRHRRLARSGLPRRSGNDRAGGGIELSEEMPRRFFHRQSGMRKLCNRQHFCLAAEFLQS